jgi:hypothetical protein
VLWGCLWLPAAFVALLVLSFLYVQVFGGSYDEDTEAACEASEAYSSTQDDADLREAIARAQQSREEDLREAAEREFTFGTGDLRTERYESVAAWCAANN